MVLNFDDIPREHQNIQHLYVRKRIVIPEFSCRHELKVNTFVQQKSYQALQK